MVQVNADYLKLKAGYLFPEISRRIKEFSFKNPNADLIRLGIGDVTEPLPLACREAMKAAIEEMGTEDGFRGYGPEQGYQWLREIISENDYESRGCEISAEEIFVSDGSKCDSSNILDILGKENKIAVTDPVYPVYVDTNVMTGRTGGANSVGEYKGLSYIPINSENGFEAAIPKEKYDKLHINSSKQIELQEWKDVSKLMQFMRNESHRFAITKHKARRAKSFVKSDLDQIPFIGKALKKELIRHFGGIKRLKGADLNELKKVNGIGLKKAVLIQKHFN